MIALRRHNFGLPDKQQTEDRDEGGDRLQNLATTRKQTGVPTGEEVDLTVGANSLNQSELWLQQQTDDNLEQLR